MIPVFHSAGGRSRESVDFAGFDTASFFDMGTGSICENSGSEELDLPDPDDAEDRQHNLKFLKMCCRPRFFVDFVEQMFENLFDSPLCVPNGSPATCSGIDPLVWGGPGLEFGESCGG